MRAEPSPTAGTTPLEERLHRLDADVDSGARDLVCLGRSFVAASLIGLAFWTALGFAFYRLLT
jgi:hypothetical protein